MYTAIPFFTVKLPSIGFKDLGKGMMLYVFWAKELPHKNINNRIS